MVLLDSLRFDHVFDLPTFRELVKRGWFFDRMYAPSTFTSSVVCSIQSGVYPPRHGYRTWDPGGRALPDNVFVKKDIKTINDYLREAGYTVVSNMSASLRKPPVKFGQDMIPRLFGYAVAHQPFFLFLHCWQIHDTCVTNRTFGQGISEENYQWGLLGTEGFLETALSVLNAAENTLWIVFGDHGLALVDEKGKCGSGSFGAGQVYDFRVRVPCVIFGPGFRMRHLRTPFSLVDFLPTVLDYLDLAPSLGFLPFHGRSMLHGEGERAVYFEAQSPNSIWPSFQPNVFGATDGRIKVMVTPDGNRCYDLVGDPREDWPCEKLLKTRYAEALLEFVEVIREDAAD